MKRTLTTFCFFFFILTGIAYGESQNAKGLSDFENLDLKTLAPGSMMVFTNTFKSLTGEELTADSSSPRPWLARHFRSGNAAWLVLLVYPGYAIPDVSFVEAHLFDEDWHRLSKNRFPTGYRMFIKEVIVTNEPVLGSDVLVIKTISAGPFVITGKSRKPAFEQGDFQLQHYAASGNRLKLVRMTDDKGQLVRNSYRAHVPFKGPEVPKRSVDDWVESLTSTNAIEVLASLVWLTGSHIPTTEARRPDVDQESIDDAKLFEEVRDTLQSRQVLKTLSTSGNRWIKEYTTFALPTSRHD